MFRTLLVSVFCATFAATPALADAGTLLGAFKNWTAYSTGEGANLTCYALSKPRAMRPASVKRNNPYLIVTDWPSRKIKAEPQINPGYEYKANAPVFLNVGAEKFEFFARNENKSGGAWLRHLAEQDKLMAALSGGVSAVAMGTPAKGAKTVDTYSLAGFGEAMAKIHAVCQM